MFTQLPSELEIVARIKMESYEREAARARLLKTAWRPSPLRKVLARGLVYAAERLAPGQSCLLPRPLPRT